ncbi:Helicase required for RNAi-mediated heterochromatin assembly 1 [Cladobotryum mycophilum]|uniref:Helicase required for RNAi-mediated heterochromatin assembly 1 n=1 Tax=Cladobotryum mycophilum TaxID=491253 RepID=A0ABR0T4H2_9HYPO
MDRPANEFLKLHDTAKISIHVKDGQFDVETGDGFLKAWQRSPAIPRAEELMSRGRLPLLENPVDIPPRSKEEYLKTQYHLYRWEGVDHLRGAIKEYKTQPTMMESDITHIYTQVYVQGYLLSRVGPACRVAFSTERSQTKVLWRQSNRLNTGTLVVLSPKSDNFRTQCIVATVASRHIVGGLEPDPESGEDENTAPRIDLSWADYSTAPVDPTVEMVMLEAKSGYFENVHHVIVGLQHAALYESVLDKYILGQSKEIKTANYVYQLPDQRCQVPAAAAHFDASQREAFTAMTSREFSIVQGPPGTGKTFTSLVAIQSYVESLWDNRNNANIKTPIIVAAQTNHALDQILGHCIQREIGDIARLGGQSKSEAIRERTLFNLREQSKCKRRGSSADPEFKAICRRLQDAFKLCFRDGLISADDFYGMGLITEEQYKSLTDSEWEPADPDSAEDPISTWLDKLVQDEPVHIYRPPEGQRVVENQDEASEKDFEPEEEDKYRLQGDFIPLKLNRGAAVSQHVLSSGAWRQKAAHYLAKNSDLYKIKPQERGMVYHYLRSQMMESKSIKDLFLKYNKVCGALKVARWENDVRMLQYEKIQIIGCTTTGLTKYRGLIAALMPRIMLIEEAAETREANITSALFPSLEQLILVGDHQQLTPHVDIKQLAGPPYNLNVSLFERMVKLNVPFSSLRVQRRMIPAIRKVVQTFYPMLEDHQIVTDPRERPPVPGMGGKNLWWFQHTWQEERDASFSYMNWQEADMIVGFVKYLVQNGLESSQITILTYYNAQLDLIFRNLCSHPFLGQITKQWAVRTVDGFQGEENDIILLSLVRSPANPYRPAAGFVAEENRAVVATSRARCGFYIFGNSDNLLESSLESQRTWQRVFDAFGVNKNVHLPLTCTSHGHMTIMENPGSWQQIPGGGCTRPCDKKCPNGHRCKEACHAFDKEHKSSCKEPCQKMLPCGHRCRFKCKDKCVCSNGCFTPKFPGQKAPYVNERGTATKPSPMAQKRLPVRNQGRRPPAPTPTPAPISRTSSWGNKVTKPQIPAVSDPCLPITSGNLINMGFRHFISMADESEVVQHAEGEQPKISRASSPQSLSDKWSHDNFVQNETEIQQEIRNARSRDSSMSPQPMREIYRPITTDANGNRIAGLPTLREHSDKTVKSWSEDNSGDLIQFD